MDEDLFAFDSQYQELLNEDLGDEGNISNYFVNNILKKSKFN